MPSCPKCGAEVDADQRMCAWCGAELGVTASPQQAPPPRTPAGAPARSATPFSSPAPPSGVSPRASGPSIEDARALARAGDLDGALMLFRTILDADSNDQEALFGMGGVHFKKGDPKRAAEAWLKLKVLNPSYPNIEGWIAQAQQKLPSSPQVTAPRRPPSSVEIPRPPRHPSPSYEDSEFGHAEEEDDWRRQPVRVNKVDAPRVESPKPLPASNGMETGKADDEAKWMGGRIPAWMIPAGWVLMLIYLGVIGLLYF